MKLARINSLLFIAIVLINGYILLLPVLPTISFWISSKDDSKREQLEAKVSSRPSVSTAGTEQTDNLIIPSMLLDEPIHTGPTAKTLRKGLWLRPQGSTPDKGGNTIIVGHRLTYADPKGTLYHLDKVKKGDTVGVQWKGTRYQYTVDTIKVVHANQTEVESPTKEPKLTIYTCTPLWLPKDRLVVTAILEERYER